MTPTAWPSITPLAGFYMSPTNTSGIAGSGYTVKVLIPVSKGLDYVILIGRDAFARDIDLYVYDEVGSLILDDRRATSRAGVKFRSSYNGTVQAIVHIARAQGLASYAVLVGRRGIERGATTVESMGVEPTFEMDGGTKPPRRHHLHFHPSANTKNTKQTPP